MTETGLTSKQVHELREQFGENKLPETPPPSNFSLLISQIKSPLVYILLFSVFITVVLKDYTDAMVIGAAVVMNTVLGFFQERRAGQALAALKNLVQPETKVIRDGNVMQVKVYELVPGDIVVLNQGDKIPADGNLVFANRFFVSEAILTGESVPISKDADAQVFMGTVVTAGQARMVVESIGQHTELGKIAESLNVIESETPLKRQLVHFSRQLTYLVLLLTIIVFIVGFAVGFTPLEVFKTSVALAVSAIPEGLLVGLTVVLAIGMQRILKNKGLVRNLISAETLGGVTTICVDKTGTLTQGKMQVVHYSGNEYNLKRQAVLANDLDDPVVIAAYEWGSMNNDIDRDQFERLDSIPFSSDNKFFVSLHTLDENRNIIFVNGAPEILLNKTTLLDQDKENIKFELNDLTEGGKRVLGFATKIVDKDKTSLSLSDVHDGLNWEGLLAFTDPVRTDVKDSLTKARDAGIKIVVITGDYSKTAVYVLNQLGLNPKNEDIILGSELETLSEEDLTKKLFGDNSIKLFARTKPEQKLKIVNLLKSHGEVVAMMGDGVNDAPALASSDIGIVVGEATDVAKESADLVLLDSSFKTIVLAIEEGRGIFDNLRKMVLFLMSDAFVAIIIVLLSMLSGLPLPLTAAQILWINLISDGFPNLALTVDTKSKNIMQRSPRSPSEPLLAGWLKSLIAIVSVFAGMVAFALFKVVLNQTGDVELARSVMFASVGVTSSVYVFSVKGLMTPVWKVNLFDNKWLLLAVLGSIILLLMPFYIPYLRGAFQIREIGSYWRYVFVSSSLVLVCIEASKYIFRHRLKSN